MARVIDDTKHYMATRDTRDFIKVFLFLEDNIFSCRPTNVVKEGGHIYFQDDNKNTTYVVKNHKGFYQAPENLMNDFFSVLQRENLQIIPWEDL